jgi:PIN domain nuclease of toxin-antitoxin system
MFGCGFYTIRVNYRMLHENRLRLREPQNGILVSAISVWEIAVKSSLGKLALPLPLAKPLLGELMIGML